MIILDATTKSLQFKLSGTVTANQLPFSSSYVDTTGTATTPGEQDGVSNNTTAVTIVSAPASSTQRLVKNIIIQNADTAAATVTIIYNNNSTLRNVLIVTLAVGDQLVYEDGHGWSCLDSNGNIKTSGAGGGGVSSVSNSDGTLTVTPPTGNVVASLAALTSTKFLVGNGSNIATGVNMSGDATLANTGAVTIANSAVTYAKIQNVSNNKLLGNTSGVAAAPSEIALPLSGSNGGTGVNNGSSTVTIGGNVVFSGAFTFTGTLSANTSVTFPTSGTLGTLGANTYTGLQTFSPSSGIAGYITAGAIEEAVYSNGNSGTSKAVNLDNGNLQSLTITGAVTVTQTTPTHPGKYTLIVTQDATGHVYSLSGIKWVGGTAPTYSTAANKIDIFSLIYDGANYYGMAGIAFS